MLCNLLKISEIILNFNTKFTMHFFIESTYACSYIYTHPIPKCQVSITYPWISANALPMLTPTNIIQIHL